MKFITSLSITFIFFVAINICPLLIESANSEEKGCRYLFDKGDNKSYTKCLETACDKGILRACGDLGYEYALRNSSAGNDKYKHGIQLLKSSCDRKDAMSCTLLGFLYSNNKKDLDVDKGFEYLNQGCLLGAIGACDIYNHAFIYFITHFSKSDTKDYNLNTKVYKNIYELTKKMCEQGIKGRRYCEGLGLLYTNGDYVKKNMVKAINIFRRGCDFEEYGACEQLATLYNEGKFIERNLELSKKYKILAHEYMKEYKKLIIFHTF